MKEYKCIMTRDDKFKVGFPTEFNEVSKTIEDYETNGWHLHTYQALYTPHFGEKAQYYHVLLFDKERTT